ncbi:MAG: Hsp20/alpha crystallin family protein [Syntrophobacterales bacterium]|nr:Hsp20/alpha crystallin family protein [Syntrophobacterales bacterium]
MARVRFFNEPDIFRPFEELRQLRREMDRLFESVMGRRAWPVTGRVFPLVNITEDKDAYYIRAELPGVRPEDIEVSIEADSITIGGERKPDDLGKEVSYHRKEREFGRFRRVITLKGGFNADTAEASFKNGILTIKLLKAEEAKPRQIQVKKE